MKILRLIGIALFAVLMCVNFTACSSDEGAPTEKPIDLSKIIIGTWMQDSDDDILVVNSNQTLGRYRNETDYKNNEEPDIFQWEIKNEWFILYYEGESVGEMCTKEIKDNMIVWKVYSEYENDYSDNYGNYSLWIWERYARSAHREN